jgi:hypothetical protein
MSIACYKNFELTVNPCNFVCALSATITIDPAGLDETTCCTYCPSTDTVIASVLRDGAPDLSVAYAINPHTNAILSQTTLTGVGLAESVYNPTDGLFYVRTNDAAAYALLTVDPVTMAETLPPLTPGWSINPVDMHLDLARQRIYFARFQGDYRVSYLNLVTRAFTDIDSGGNNIAELDYMIAQDWIASIGFQLQIRFYSPTTLGLVSVIYDVTGSWREVCYCPLTQELWTVFNTGGVNSLRVYRLGAAAATTVGGAGFNVPAVGATVDVPVVDSTRFIVGDATTIAPDTYTVEAILSILSIRFRRTGGASIVGAFIPGGTAVTGTQPALQQVATSSPFNATPIFWDPQRSKIVARNAIAGRLEIYNPTTRALECMVTTPLAGVIHGFGFPTNCHVFVPHHSAFVTDAIKVF